MENTVLFVALTTRPSTMKNFGSHFEYEKQRNDDLMRCYREHLSRRPFIHLPEVLEDIVNSPSARFWVSEERAAIVMSQMMRGDQLEKMRPLKREMFQEIYKRVMMLKEEHPDWPLSQLAFEVVRQPAPKFYLTPGSAKVIISKIRRQWYEERKKKLRFMW